MSDRHLHCVYFRYDDKNSVEGICLLSNDIIEKGYEHCCDNIVLRPMSILSYFLKHEGYCGDWECADKKALEYLERTGFNNYPVEVLMSEEDEKAVYEYLQIINKDIFKKVE